MLPTRRLALLALLAPAWLAAQGEEWRGTWSATGGRGVLAGGWTARRHTEPNTVVGTWTLVDPNGRQLAAGTWSARKAGKAWQGSWQARESKGAMAGTWSARLAGNAAAPFAALFEAALRDAISGGWQRGRQSGAWSIRAVAGG